MNRFFNWVKKGATNLMGFMGFGKPAESSPSATEPSPQTSESSPSQLPVSFLSAAANGLKSLPSKAKNMASGLVTAVFDAAQGAVNMVTTGYNAVKQKAADMVEKVQDNVVSNVIASAVKKFKTWVSDNKGLVTAAAAALAAVLAILFWPVVAALGGLLNFAATKKTPSANAEAPLRSATDNSTFRMMSAGLAQELHSEEDDAALAQGLHAEEVFIANQVHSDSALAAALAVEDMPAHQANVDQAAHLEAPAAPRAAVANDGYIGLGRRPVFGFGR